MTRLQRRLGGGAHLMAVFPDSKTIYLASSLDRISPSAYMLYATIARDL